MFGKIKTIVLAISMVALPSAAISHASEQGLVMLLPTELYRLGGTLAVGATVLLMALLPAQKLERVFGNIRLGNARFLGWVETPTSLFSSILFALLIYIGFAGPPDPQSNLLPLFIWTGWWIGIFVIQGLVFDIWKFINPWTSLARVLLDGSSPILKIPRWLGHWPAVAVFLSFQLFLLADIAPNDPDRLATFALGYWLFTFAGIVLFGSDQFLSRVECFTVLFRLVGTLRALHHHDNFRIGLPGWASVASAPLDTSRAVFCIMILISGSFDGLHESFWWLGLIGINPLEFPGRSAVVWQSSIGLIVANLGGVVVYAASVWMGIGLVRWLGKAPRIQFKMAFNTFAIAILPIALGYHIAHYLISFLVQGQYLIATIADPLAQGWNLFGLGQQTIRTGFLNTMDTVRPILLTCVGVVVFSHVLSVIMAHRLAGMLCDTRRNMFLIQLGLSLIMIAYTIFGLWLLSTPRGA